MLYLEESLVTPVKTLKCVCLYKLKVEMYFVSVCSKLGQKIFLTMLQLLFICCEGCCKLFLGLLFNVWLHPPHEACLWMSIQHDVSADQVSYSPLQIAELNAIFFCPVHNTNSVQNFLSALSAEFLLL